MTDWIYRGRVHNVVDADTVDAQLFLEPKRREITNLGVGEIFDLGFRVYADTITTSMVFDDRFRFDRINAWETRGRERPEGLVAKARVEEAVRGREIRIETRPDTERGKYGRWLATLWVPEWDRDGGLEELDPDVFDYDPYIDEFAAGDGKLPTLPLLHREIDGRLWLNLNAWLVHFGHARWRNYG